ncbi:alpha/beta fold hydrolase [Pelagerythrobacter aerophilus]
MDLIGPVSRSYISQRTKLHYADWGNPEAPPLILLHGGRDHCRSWDWTAKALRDDWHVICPDLRGHGDSGWSRTGHYQVMSYVFDLLQLVLLNDLAPVTIVAHSLGGNVALRFTGLYPDKVRKLVAIEGLGSSPERQAEREAMGPEKIWGDYFEKKREAAARQPRRYATFEDALSRMHEANSYLSAEQALHLTQHAVMRNEDGTFSWKFDPHVHAWPPEDMTYRQMEALWNRIECPTRLIYGNDSWASNPAKDGRLAHFRTATVTDYDNAGHWVHHDRFDDFLAELREFL